MKKTFWGITLFVTTLFVSFWGCQDEGQDFFSAMFNRFDKNDISIELESKQNGNIKLTIFNNSEKDFYLSENDFPLKDFEKNSFKVYDGIDFLPYTGRFFYKTDNNWFKMEPGQVKSVAVFLPQSYQFYYPDTYEIFFDSLITIKFSDNDIRVFNITSDMIEVKINEWAVLYRPRAVMKPCSASQRSLLARGKRISKADVTNASIYLAKKKADNYYVKWFGKYTSVRYRIVKDGYNKIINSYDQGWKYSCETRAGGGCNGWAAYVYKNQPYKVWVCMDYYEKTSDRNRGTLMTHEASHWNVNFGANDYGYGYTTGINLAKSDPNKAVDCANNIEYYTDDIPDADPPPEPPVDPPDDDLAGFRLAKKVFSPNEIIKINCAQLNSKKSYMVGIYKNKKLVGNKKRFIYNMTSAVKKIKAPKELGGYKVRLSIKGGDFLHKKTIRVK